MKVSFLIKTVVAIVLAECVLVGLIAIGPITFDPEIGLTALTGIPLLIITIMQLSRNIHLQRASFIKDYVSKFFIEDKLYEIYHSLIYNYDNELFEKIDEIANNNLNVDTKTPSFEYFEEFQDGRKEGNRLYHPGYFQGSQEEMRLDTLLGYLDIIGYYYYRRLVKMEDISGSMGQYLAMIGQRKVVSEYLQICKRRWREKTREDPSLTLSAVEPFAYLRRLLAEFEDYNRKTSRKIQQVLDRSM